METLIPQVSTRDLALVVFKRKWSITVIVLVTMIAAAFWLFVMRDEQYTVSTRVLVKLGREQAPPPSVMGASPMVIAYRSQDLTSRRSGGSSTSTISIARCPIRCLRTSSSA
jgi:uncharacterized protein involved in exopolysaccharide biosynthesis